MNREHRRKAGDPLPIKIRRSLRIKLWKLSKQNRELTLSYIVNLALEEYFKNKELPNG